jgi:hypothetical protein
MIRCTRCLLPDTYPDIRFDDEGVCNHCLLHKTAEPLGEQRFIEKIRSRRGTRYDCVLGISGGKDSCYVAYLAKKKFGLRALAVCYDFAFMVDLARNNVKAVCDSLGLDLLVVKSRNNVEYDLLRNHLTSMAATGTTWGQCMFCHYGIEAILQQTARERGAPFILSGTTSNELWWNPGSRTRFLGNRVKRLPLKEKILFAVHQGRAFLNLADQRAQFPIPGHSRFDVYRRARVPSDGPETIPVYDYVGWDQRVIEGTLREETGWEKPPRALTWRYDCILEPLLDYTYKKEFGISSGGLYLCGLIRSGLMDRAEALRHLDELEDQGRLDQSLKRVLDFLEIPPVVQRKFSSDTSL